MPTASLLYVPQAMFSLPFKGHHLQEIITGPTNMPVSTWEDAPGWQDLGARLLEVSLPCTRLLWLPGAKVSPHDCTGWLFSAA